MFWDKKKKDEGLPELPRSSSLPLRYPPMATTPKDDLDHEDTEIHELPAFPDSPMRSGFSQTAIKDAISQEEIGEEIPELPARPAIKRMEMQEWQPKTSPIADLPSPSMSKSREAKPIFVRVDKYQIALSALDNVKAKLTEIEDLMKQIREVKNREDQELSSWEVEMENIKARIQTVMSEIFDKAEY
jgi:hypothetical protein